MEYDEVISWLQRRVKKDAISALTLGLVTLIAGIVLLAVTWVVIYSVALLCLQWVSGTWGILTVIIPTLAIAALFWGNATTSREYLSEYKVTTGTSSSRVISFYLPGAGMVSNVNPLAPDTADAMTKLIVVGALSLLGSGVTFFLAYRSLRLNLRGTGYMWGLASFSFVFGIWRIARGIDRLITGAWTEGSLTEL